MSRGVPQVSIGLPVYNGERFLEETLTCLLAQTYTDFEIVIADNASTDRTAELCRQYADRDPRIRYERNGSNVGAAQNLAKVIERSRGRYFKLSNGDDLCAPELVADCVAVLERHPDAVLAYGKTSLIDDQGRVIRRYSDDLHLPMTDAAARFRRVIERVRMINVIQGVMRADVAKRLITHHETYYGGDQVWVAALALSGQFHELPAFSFFRRMHAAASSAIKDQAALQEYLDPNEKRPLPLYLWRLYSGYLKTVARAPLSPGPKLRALAALARVAITCRDTLRQELTGALGHVVRNAAAHYRHPSTD